MIPLRMRWFMFTKLTLPCRLWKLRGLPTCPYHGSHAQSWWTGYCKKCGEIPVVPPMEDICTFCGKEKAVLQRSSPNGDKKIWDLCWECNEFLDWSFENSTYIHAKSMGIDMDGIKDPKDFDQWLFDKHRVWPKEDYASFTLKKKSDG